MRRFVIAGLLLAGIAGTALADLSNHGGPVLKSFEIVPYYYGPWTAAKIDEHQKYLVGLAQYISGANAPANSQPMLVQYGVTSAGVRAPIKKLNAFTQPVTLSTPDALKVIHDAQTAGTVPLYASNRLIMLLLPTGSTFSAHCAFHGSEAVDKYYAMVSQDCGPWLQVTAHEVFEAATDPAIGNSPAWDEAVDPCGTSFKTWFGDVPGAYDNAIHGCSTSGYDAASPSSVTGSFTAVWSPGTTPEIQMSGATYASYRARYDELWNVGWRLSILQPYVRNGQLFYNAVWRPGNESEIQVYGWTYNDYRAKYDQLWNQGWRLKILQPYVVNGDVRYTAVFRPSTEGETQVYGWAYNDYRAKYDQLWNQGWRLKLISVYSINGQVRYTAVWRPATSGEIQVYSWAYNDYRTKYDALLPSGLRLQSLQAY